MNRKIDGQNIHNGINFVGRMKEWINNGNKQNQNEWNEVKTLCPSIGAHSNSSFQFLSFYVWPDFFYLFFSFIPTILLLFRFIISLFHLLFFAFNFHTLWYAKILMRLFRVHWDANRYKHIAFIVNKKKIRILAHTNDMSKEWKEVWENEKV